MPNSRSIPFEFPFRLWIPATPVHTQMRIPAKTRFFGTFEIDTVHARCRGTPHARLLCAENRTKRTLVCHHCYVRCIHTLRYTRKMYSQNLHSDSKCKYFNCLSFDFEQFVQCGATHTQHTHASDPTISISIHVCMCGLHSRYMVVAGGA